MKKIWWIAAAVILLPIAWYLLSPAFIVVEANDPSPLDEGALAHLTQEDREAFDVQMGDMAEGKEMADTMPGAAQVVQMGTLKPKAHDVQGVVKIIETGESKLLRFEDFETINGPELHIYLATDTSANDYIDLGIIKATKGSVNYDVPSDVDTETYSHVLVWCEPFRVLFSYAELA